MPRTAPATAEASAPRPVRPLGDATRWAGRPGAWLAARLAPRGRSCAPARPFQAVSGRAGGRAAADTWQHAPRLGWRVGCR